MLESYFEELSRAFDETVATNADFRSFKNPIDTFITGERLSHSSGRKIFVIGNGGSAAIASHVVTDLCKTAKMRGVSLNDTSVLTCFANDYGFEYVYSKQLELHGNIGDTLIAISSSGESQDIYNAVTTAVRQCMTVATFTGFSETNRLRQMGDINFYVPSNKYGIVELTHQIILHAITDKLAEPEPGVNFSADFMEGTAVMQ